MPESRIPRVSETSRTTLPLLLPFLPGGPILIPINFLSTGTHIPVTPAEDCLPFNPREYAKNVILLFCRRTIQKRKNRSLRREQGHSRDDSLRDLRYFFDGSSRRRVTLARIPGFANFRRVLAVVVIRAEPDGTGTAQMRACVFLEIIVDNFRSRDFFASDRIHCARERTDRTKRKENERSTESSFKCCHKRERNLCGLLVGKEKKRNKRTERDREGRRTRTEGRSTGRVQAVSIAEYRHSFLSLRFNFSSGLPAALLALGAAESHVYTM